jgi:hypothetical protein
MCRYTEAAEAGAAALRERLNRREGELAAVQTEAGEAIAMNAALEAAAAAAAHERAVAVDSEKEQRRQATSLRERLEAETTRWGSAG